MPTILVYALLFVATVCVDAWGVEKTVTKSDHTLTVMLTPIVFSDFNDPQPDVQQFYDYHQDLLHGFKEVIVILAVGQAEQILAYRGKELFDDTFPWAKGMTDRQDTLSLRQIKAMADSLRSEGRRRGYAVKIFEFLEPGPEFCGCPFKYERHPECLYKRPWDGERIRMDITSALHADKDHYATYPDGIPEGTGTAEFVIRQTGAYLDDLGFDGVNLCNAMGTVGQWEPQLGRGYTEREAQAILKFFKDLKARLGEKEIFWMDSYWNTKVEHDAWSIDPETYRYMDYIQLSTWSVIASPPNPKENLLSKIRLSTPIIFQVDYFDPWYHYDSIQNLLPETKLQLKLLREHLANLQGVYINANDEKGRWLPMVWIDRINDLYLQDDQARSELLARRTRRDLQGVFQEAPVPADLSAAVTAAKTEGYLISVAGRRERTAAYLSELSASLNMLIAQREQKTISQSVCNAVAESLSADLFQLTEFGWGGGSNGTMSVTTPLEVLAAGKLDLGLQLTNCGGVELAGRLYVTRTDGVCGDTTPSEVFRALSPGQIEKAVLRVTLPSEQETAMSVDLCVEYTYPVSGPKPAGKLSVDVDNHFAIIPHQSIQRGVLKKEIDTLTYGRDGIKMAKRIQIAGDSLSWPDQVYVRKWQILGPFKCSGAEHFRQATDIESRPIKLDAAYQEAGKTLRWQAHESPGSYIDCRRLFPAEEINHHYVYAYTAVYCPRRADARIGLGIDNVMRLMVNGKLVLDREQGGGSQPEQARAEAVLEKGWNTVLVKLWDMGGPWGFHFRLVSPDVPFSELKFDSTQTYEPAAEVK